MLTTQAFNKGVSHQVVFEWEEDFCKELNVEYKYMKSHRHYPIARFLRKIGLTRSIKYKHGEEKYLLFAMNINFLKLVSWYEINVLPIVLDISLSEIDDFYKLTKNLPVSWVTSIQIVDAIKEKYPDSTVQYMPQMVSDRYLSENFEEKSIDFLQFGRRNPVLHEYARKYCDEHPGRSYLYRHENQEVGMVKYSNFKEEYIGEILTRKEFMQYLNKTKISLCSSPNRDNTRDFGENIDFLTARWFESAVCRCFIFARVSQFVEPELDYTQLDKLVFKIETYDDFERRANDLLIKKIQNFVEAEDFCNRNSAKKRARLVNEILFNIEMECSEV